MTKHLNLARIQAISKRCICICLGFTDCNRWIFHLRWEAADPGIRGEENRGWVGRKVEMWAAGACSCEVPGHGDGNGQSGEGRQLPKRAGIPGIGAQGWWGVWDQASGRRLQRLEQGHRPGEREQSQHSQEAGQEVGGFCWVRRNILSLQVLGNDHSFAARKDLREQGRKICCLQGKTDPHLGDGSWPGVCDSPGAVSQGCQSPGRGDLPFRSSWNSVSLQCLGAVLAFPKMFS